MNIQEIIFKILTTDPQLWIKYSIVDKNVMHSDEERIEIKNHSVSRGVCRLLQKEGFEMLYVKTERKDIDVYANVLFTRKYVNAKGTTATP